MHYGNPEFKAFYKTLSPFKIHVFRHIEAYTPANELTKPRCSIRLPIMEWNSDQSNSFWHDTFSQSRPLDSMASIP